MTQIVSSISSLEIYAPSAGSATYAKCDTSGRALTKMVMSADVSAYQVVSATGSQLYAGTAHLTSVNTAPISAARAGNAANASMANSAYYDGTGRLISALPDSATVSAIASGYASSKADASSLSSYALSADVSGCIDTVSSNSASWGGGATGDYVEKSSYQNSLGTSNTLLNTSTASTYLINGTGISANLGGAYVQFVNGSNSTANKNAFINGYGNRASGFGAIFGLNSTAWDNSLVVGGSQYAEYDALAIGAYGSTAKSNAMSIGGGNSASGFGFTLGSGLNAKQHVLALGTYNSAYDGTSVALVIGNGYVYNDGGWKTARHDLMVVTKDGEITMYSSTADTTGTGIMSSIRAISAAATGASVSLPITGSAGSDSATYAATSVELVRNDTAGEPDIRTASMSPDQFQINYTYNNQDYTSMTLSESTLDFEDSEGSHVVDAYSIDSWNSAVDTVANNSASWGQSGPVTATASAAAKAYTSTSTSVSSFTGISSINGSALLARNLLPNAQQANGDAHFHFMPTTSPWGSTEYTGLLGPLQYATGAALAMKQQGAYGAFYKGNEWFISDVGTNTAANGVIRAELHRTRGIHLYGSSLNSATGFHMNGSGINGQSGASSWQYGPVEYDMLTSVNDTVYSNSATWGAGGVDSATCSAIASSYANDVSAAVSGTVDTVSAQSANWGGSALALSAGPGVSLTKSGNTLIAGLDETVLWSGSAVLTTAGQTIPLSEPCTNFDRIKIYGESWLGWTPTLWCEASGSEPQFTVMFPYMGANGDAIRLFQSVWKASGTNYIVSNCKVFSLQGATASTSNPTNNWARLVVGINRTAGV